ncbi:MAG: GNAT family N-acetyltransferase [Candidatus Cryptobacteroides sp.]
MNKNYIIRPETEADYKVVENLCRESFWNVYQPGCTEHYVLHHLRPHPDFIPELDFVMEVEGQIIGQIVFCCAEILADDGRRIPILTFGPISIAPDYKRRGYGLALLERGLAEAKKMGFGAVCMEGNIDFYGKAGFELASAKGIHYHGMDPSDPVPFFLCLELKEGYLSGIEGVYHTPQPYFVAQENPEDFEAFDRAFPPKEKLRLPGQLF